MKHTIIADSCCNLFAKDLTNKMIDFHVIPLTIIIDEQEIIDDENLNTLDLIAKMKTSKSYARSACPTADAFYEKMRDADNVWIVTLSSKLSATHASAVTAVEQFKQEFPNKKVFIVDTLNASSGIDHILFHLRDLIMAEKYSFDEIGVKILEQRNKTAVRFMLQDLTNLIKNGRLNKVVGKVLSAAHVKLICGDDGQGEIKKYGLALTVRQGHMKLADMPIEMVTTDKPIFISHVHNEVDAKLLEEILRNKHGFKDVQTRPMRGISSMYANDKGIILAF